MRRLIFFFVIFLIGVIYFVMGKSSKPHQFFIVCTTTIIADAVQHIGGEYIFTKTLMGPGIDPHLYRARESDVSALSNADIIFYNGLHLEGKMGDIFAQMNRYVPTIAVAESIPIEKRISSDFAGMYDPHVWHDVSLWMHVIPVITCALSKKDPDHASYYQENAKSYSLKLKELEADIRKKITSISKHQRILVTAHDAFAYYGRAYGFQVVGLQGISTDAQVSAYDIQKSVKYIIENDIPALFLESSIPPQSIEAVQRAVQAGGYDVVIAQELFSDSLGDQSTTAHTYCGMIQYNTEVIVSALTH